jgi:hypothetical protein
MEVETRRADLRTRNFRNFFPKREVREADCLLESS